jgi:glycosyltransferase involved in cell wall biosynthesis
MIKKKRPCLSIDIANELNKELILNGIGNKKIERCVSKKAKDNYLGLTNFEDINNKMKESSFLLMPSKSEGFPLTIVEAFSNGLPVLLFDTYPIASYLIGDNQRGIITKNKKDLINKIKSLSEEEYIKMKKNCLSFYKENLTLEN